MSKVEQSQQLVILCHQMHKAGLQPSVGLLRSKAPFKVSVTEAIDAVKTFNASSQMPASNQQPKDSERVLRLEKRVSDLEAALVVLEQRLANLDG